MPLLKSRIITRTAVPCQTPTWQAMLAEAITDVAELLATLDLTPAQLKNPVTHPDFPLRVPRGFVARMEKGNAVDPLLLQVLPGAAEACVTPGYHADPVADQDAMVIPGVLHKYQGRVLLIATGACAIHCRYCFRQHFPYQEANAARAQWQQAVTYIGQQPQLHEVILSGGDPLMLGDHKLQELVLQLAAIPHVRRLRIHSRLPIVVPQRITPALIQVLTGTRLQTLMVLHCNHPNEIDAEVQQALQTMQRAGITLLNQAVLLHGINHLPQTQRRLSETLFHSGVLPYYLHMLDQVQGAAHFEVPESAALELMQQLQASLPGYLVPRLVREIPGAPAKVPVV